MIEVDLWEDDDELELLETLNKPQKEVITLKLPTKEVFTSSSSLPHMEKKALIRINNGKIELFVKGDLRKKDTVANDLESIYGLEEEVRANIFIYRANLGAVNAYVFRHILKLLDVEINQEQVAALSEYANKIKLPQVRLADTGKHVDVIAPNIKLYQSMLKRVNAYPRKDGLYRVGIGRVLDLEQLSANAITNLPKITFMPEVLNLNRENIPGFDGSLNSLKKIPINSLNIVNSNLQQWRQLKNSNKTLEEKLTTFGIKTLHDLLFTLPKRFIDKTNPEELEDLLEGESVTIVGKIITVGELPNRMGVKFGVENSRNRKINVTFWRQQWLKTKFKIGEEILITGKVTRFKNKIELSGSSIEHADEAAILPIVPVYKQSPSSGITTQLLMTATREMLSRLDKIILPEYLQRHGKLDYTEALTELHFPSSIERYKGACDDLAYYELIYMQLYMQEEKASAAQVFGLEQREGSRKLQEKSIATMPFELTNSQKEGIENINKLMALPAPSQMLLNADVGSGKTLIAQLACLQSVDAGYQAVLIGPTEILARQLYSTFMQLNEDLKTDGEEIRIELLQSGLKAKEKRELLARIKAHEIDVIVGTTSVLGKSVDYNNLGLVVIDEQQKFGAAQRTQLLSSRADGLVPDLLMQTATPIPRSTAQVFYGDMEMILLKEKPPGRIPIVTEWIEEDPIEFAHQLTNPIWSDVQKEAAKGNQTFVITPMVRESDKIDAASVERTFKELTSTTLSGLRIGFVHGRVKPDEQKQVMEDFRNKKYDVLVASLVVEVGVDIPDATRMIILSADRLGAASLHQIRGRVGRSNKPSKCYLVSLGKTENSRVRLQSLVDSENGFDIALADLDVRGEGRMFSTEQSGASDMIFASLARHKEWIEPAKRAALKILASPLRELALTDTTNRFETPERLF